MSFVGEDLLALGRSAVPYQCCVIHVRVKAEWSGEQGGESKAFEKPTSACSIDVVDSCGKGYVELGWLGGLLAEVHGHECSAAW